MKVESEESSLENEDFDFLTSEQFFEHVQIALTAGNHMPTVTKNINLKQKDGSCDGEGSSVLGLFKGYEADSVTGLPKMPAFDKNLNYMDEYWNIYL